MDETCKRLLDVLDKSTTIHTSAERGGGMVKEDNDTEDNDEDDGEDEENATEVLLIEEFSKCLLQLIDNAEKATIS